MNIWHKITAFMAAALAICWLVIKRLAGKNKKLKHELKVKDRATEIRQAQEEATGLILEDEEDRIAQKTKEKRVYTADELNKW